MKNGECTNDIVKEVVKLVKVDLSSDQISTFHCLPAKPKRNVDFNTELATPIIVRFLSRDVRNKLYANRKQLLGAETKAFFVNGTNNIYFNENLTRSRKRLFWNVKQKAKALDYKCYWTANGNIFVKKSDETKPNPFVIKNGQDLQMLN